MEFLKVARQVVRVGDILHAQLEQFRLRIPDDLTVPLIDGDKAAIEVGQGYAARRLRKNGLQPRVTLRQSGPRDSTRQAVSSLNALLRTNSAIEDAGSSP